MKIKTSELQGAALDWAVAKCGGKEFYPTTDPDRYDVELGLTHNFNPSVDWSQGGPIIEREKISVTFSDVYITGATLGWYAEINFFYDGMELHGDFCHNGDTPLIAAMRCYVASKLGDTVEIPNELVNK